MKTFWCFAVSLRLIIVGGQMFLGLLCWSNTAMALAVALTIHDLTEEQVTVTSSIDDDESLDVSKPDPGNPEFLHFRYKLGGKITADSEIDYVLMQECAKGCRSDIFELAFDKGSDFLDVFFWSDGATNFPDPKEFVRTINENGKVQDLITYTGGPFVFFKAESDPCNPTDKANGCLVSEPPALPLCAASLLMLWLQSHRRSIRKRG